MNFRSFLIELNKIGYGVLSFNTYHINNEYCFYIAVAKKGNKGTFFKKEGVVAYIDGSLEELIEQINNA